MARVTGSAVRASAERLVFGVATVCLLPVLVAQAWHVRRVTPRLPEPSGARSGTDGTGPALRLLIAGDSAAAGVGAETQRDALSGQLVAALARSFRVSWTLAAQSGRTSKDVVAAIRAAATEPFDVVLISVGVNDVTGWTGSRAWLERQNLLIDLAKAKFAAAHVVFSGLPPMHAFPALPQPLRWYLGMRARRLNDLLRGVVGSEARCELLSVTFPLESRYMAADGFHPGPAAYALWGDAAAQAIERRIRAAPQR